MSSFLPPTISDLEQDYIAAKEAVNKYVRANLIDVDSNCMDSYFLKLCLKREKAYYEYKKATIPEKSFYRIHAPVINNRILILNEKLRRVTRRSSK